MPIRSQAPKWANNLERSFNLERAAIDIEKRTVPLSFSSETTEVIRWGDVEILDHSPGACDLTQLNDIGVLLFNHDVDMPIGGIDSATVVNNRGEAVVRFDEDEQSDVIFQKVRSGTLKAVSCRYTVSVWEVVDPNAMSSDGRFQGPCWIARKWKVLEISIVSIPADASVGVGRSAEESDSRSDKQKRKRSDSNMTPEEIAAFVAEYLRQAGIAPATAPAAAATPAGQTEAERKAELDDENLRCAEIIMLCRDYGTDLDPVKFIQERKSVADVQAEVLRKLKDTKPATETARSSVIEEESVKFSRAAVDAILLRDGTIKVEKPAEGAQELRSMRLRDLMIECCERQGNSKARRLGDEDLIREALTGSGAFPGILSNAANKSMADGYSAAETTYQAWVGTGSNPDFKAASHYKLSEAGDLVQMTENGEFKADEATEESVTKSVLTFGRSWSLSRKAIINDDLSALTRLPARYSASAARGINTLVYTKLVTSANFTAPRGNLAATVGAPTVITIGAGRAAMRKQTNVRSKETLNVAPKFIIVPAALETNTEQLLASITDPASANANVKNPFTGKLTMVCDAVLDTSSTTAWYLLAQAGLVDTIEVTYLNGNTTPNIESHVSFDVLGMKWRIYIDYGVTVLDYRGMYKNAGA